jgi:hypothetical protein
LSDILLERKIVEWAGEKYQVKLENQYGKLYYYF